MSITELVDRIIADGKLTRDEHEKFLKMVNEDGRIDAEESEQITRLMEMIEKGELRVTKH